MIFDGISRAIEKKDNLAIAKAYQQLGRLMIRWHNYKDADKYLHTSLKINKKENHKFHIVNDYINLVVSKIHQSSKDSVDYYLNILRNESQHSKLNNAECSYFINKAYANLKFDNNPKAAKVNIDSAFNITKQSNSIALRAYSHQMYGEYYYHINDFILAKDHLLKAYSKINSIIILQDRSNITKLLSKTYKKLNQPDSAYLFLHKTDSINKRIHHREDILMLYKKDNELTVQRAKQEKETLVKENKKLFNRIILIRIFYIVMSLTLISLLVMFMRKRTNRLKTEIELKDQVQIKLKEQSKIDQSTIEKTNELIKIKEETIASLKLKLRTDLPDLEQINELESLFNSKLITEEDWDNYLSLFSKKNPLFLPKLKDHFPNLSRNEIKIFTLIKLGLSTRDMSGILMISPSSVNTARYRLRKKLNLETDESLEDIIGKLFDLEVSIK